MSTRPRTARKSATERLIRLVEAELKRQNLTGQEAAREARLPANTFGSLLRERHQPMLNRADEILAALGTSMTIGVMSPNGGSDRDDKTNRN